MQFTVRLPRWVATTVAIVVASVVVATVLPAVANSDTTIVVCVDPTTLEPDRQLGVHRTGAELEPAGRRRVGRRHRSYWPGRTCGARSRHLSKSKPTLTAKLETSLDVQAQTLRDVNDDVRASVVATSKLQPASDPTVNALRDRGQRAGPCDREAHQRPEGPDEGADASSCRASSSPVAVSSAAPLEGRRRLAGTWGRPWLREGAAIGCVLVAMTVVLAPLVFRGELPRATDTIAFYGPFAAFLHDQLANGKLPLWNPTAFSGQPFAADAQSGVVYPPALLAFGLLSPSSGLVALTIFHYALAALGAYAFARVVGAGRLGSIYAAIAYGASGHLVARSTMLGLLAGVAWLPGLPGGGRARSARAPRPAAGGRAAARRSRLPARSSPARSSSRPWRRSRPGSGCCCARDVAACCSRSPAVAAAALLSAVALLPRLELLRHSSSAEGVADPSGIGSLVFATTCARSTGRSASATAS